MQEFFSVKLSFANQRLGITSLAIALLYLRAVRREARDDSDNESIFAARCAFPSACCRDW